MTDTAEQLTPVLAIVHGAYGPSLISAAETIVGPLNITIAEYRPEKSPEQVRERIHQQILRQHSPNGVLLLTDLCGSTPCNICLSLLRQYPEYEMISGINLAMLIKLWTCSRTLSAKQIAQELRKTAQRSIVLGSELLHKKGLYCGD